MSGWNDWGWYKPAPKRPPPQRGIKMKKAGSTWWGQRWVEALEYISLGYSNRLARGRTYARAGRTHDLVVKAGEVTAKVTGSRATPYRVRISLAKLSEATWRKAVAAMAGKAQFAAELLAGQMPHEIDAAFKAAGARLFPAKEADLRTSCSCPDWANPCKHVAATHFVLGEALDRDPFLLFELRGRTKEHVLAALRAARAVAGDVASAARARKEDRRTAGDNEVPRVSLGRLASAEYDKPSAPLPALHFAFETPSVSGAVLRQLGAPAAWSSDTSPAETLAPILRAAAEQARRLALAEREPFEEAGQPAAGPRAAHATARKGRTREFSSGAGAKLMATSPTATGSTSTKRAAMRSKNRGKQ